MAARSLIPYLTDMVEAIERVRGVLGDIELDAFEADWQRKWLIERGIEIVSEASRHLTDELKARHPEIPWSKVAGIGNVLRHDYGTSRRPSCGNSSARIYRHSNAFAVTSWRPRLPRRTDGKFRHLDD